MCFDASDMYPNCICGSFGRQLPWREAILQGRDLRVEARGQRWQALPQNPTTLSWRTPLGTTRTRRASCPTSCWASSQTKIKKMMSQKAEVTTTAKQMSQNKRKSHPRRRRREAKEMSPLRHLLRHLRQLRGASQGVVQARIQARLAQVGLEIHVSQCILYVSEMYRECILCVMYLKCRIEKFSFVSPDRT